MSLLQNDGTLSAEGLFQYAHFYWRVAWREWKGRWAALGKAGTPDQVFDGLRQRARGVVTGPADVVVYRGDTRCCAIALDHVRDVILPGWRQPDRKGQKEALDDALFGFSLEKDVDRGLTKFVRSATFWRWRKAEDRLLRLGSFWPGEDVGWAASLGISKGEGVPFLGALVCYRLDKKLWLGITSEPSDPNEYSDVVSRMRGDAEVSPAEWGTYRQFDKQARSLFFDAQMAPVMAGELPVPGPEQVVSASASSVGAPIDVYVRHLSLRRRSVLSFGAPGLEKALPRIHRRIREGSIEKAVALLGRRGGVGTEFARGEVGREAEFLRVVDASHAFNPKVCPRGVTPRQALVLAGLVGWRGDGPCSWSSPVEQSTLLAWAGSHYGGPSEDLVVALNALVLEGLFFEVHHLVFRQPVYYCSYGAEFLEELPEGGEHVAFWERLLADNEREWGPTWRSTGVCVGQGSQSYGSRSGPCLGTSCCWFEDGKDCCQWELAFNETLVQQRRGTVKS